MSFTHLCHGPASLYAALDSLSCATLDCAQVDIATSPVISIHFCLWPTDEDDMGGEDSMDQQGLTKKDIHTINEQKRRDIIKVR